MHPTNLDAAYPERASFTDLTGETFGLFRVERYVGRKGMECYGIANASASAGRRRSLRVAICGEAGRRRAGIGEASER